MKTIIIILKNTQGIFNSTMNLKHSTRYNIAYRSIQEDKINIRNDLLTLFSDFKKATNEAKIKQVHYE